MVIESVWQTYIFVEDSYMIIEKCLEEIFIS